MILMYMIGYIAIQFLTLATALYKIYGIPLMLTVVLIAIATTVYMHFGGQTSVIFTDLILFRVDAVLQIFSIRLKSR